MADGHAPSLSAAQLAELAMLAEELQSAPSTA